MRILALCDDSPARFCVRIEGHSYTGAFDYAMGVRGSFPWHRPSLIHICHNLENP